MPQFRYNYFYDAFMNLTEREVIQGYPGGTYGPERNVTRCEVAVILAKA
ncbi:S-layer homology domain-containing protein [Ureibacillus sp. GCM10028918]